ncbi:MAG: photosynthetic complex putative assembly protein PuhB [Pseudomonadota bacterium]
MSAALSRTAAFEKRLRADGADVTIEAVHGLSKALPEGERVLWQGMPDWRRLAWRAFGVRWVAAYFAAIAFWRVMDGLASGAEGLATALSVLLLLPLALMAGAILALMAWVSARVSVYTLTNRRVVMRIGVVTTITLNLPLSWIGTAALKRFKDGSGDIALQTTGKTRLAYLMLWPHVRPWRLASAEPALRALPRAGVAAEALAQALREAQPGAEAQAVPEATLDRPIGTSEGGLVPAE